MYLRPTAELSKKQCAKIRDSSAALCTSLPWGGVDSVVRSSLRFATSVCRCRTAAFQPSLVLTRFLVADFALFLRIHELFNRSSPVDRVFRRRMRLLVQTPRILMTQLVLETKQQYEDAPETLENVLMKRKKDSS